MPVLTSTRVAMTALTVGLLTAGALSTRPLLAARPQQPVVTDGGANVLAEEIDFDAAQGVTVLKGNVEVTTGSRILRADQMTLKQIKGSSDIEWAKANGHVHIEDKPAPRGDNQAAKSSTMTATGERGEYRGPEQQASLEGNVVLHYSAERLAEPATITGTRADIDMKADRAVIHGSADRQAKAIVKPKGQPPAEGQQPTPTEPIQLTADTLTRDGQMHTFTAVGNPKMVRGKSSQMTADTIWFELDPEKDDLKTAHGDEHVVVDDEDEQNGHIHAIGDHMTYDQPTEVMTLTGHVRASQQLKDQPQPRTLSGGQLVYNSKTKAWSIRHAPGERVQVVYPQPPKPANGSGTGTPATPGASGTRSK